VIKSRDFQDFDFLVLDHRGFPHLYLEIKVRRQSLDVFGDAIFPFRKHSFASRLLRAHSIRLIAVVEYPDALVEVDLSEEPNQVQMIKRSDRPRAVKHALYDGDQLKVLERYGE
jgi:hypothetical protein